MYVVIWRYRVEPAQAAKFEKAYGPKGEWAKLFGESKDYLGTELLADDERPGEYVTIDRWSGEEAYSAFLRQHEGDYGRLDRRFEALTLSESRVGAYGPAGKRP
ncbi:MAG: antibiotic biosynthesis monooxygenase [Burkholderiales bacterium]